MAYFHTSSPTVVLPPQPDQYFGQSHLRQSPPRMGNPLLGRTASPPKPLPFAPQASIVGRKRSRDDDDEEPTMTAPVQTPPANRGDPVYGPGMTLIYPNDPSGFYNMDASSQSGTWVESHAETTATKTQRPTATSRKSQRLDSSAPKPDDIALHAEPDCRRTNATEPLIDEVTRLLGISWMRMDASEALQISQKAYTKWIQRHYPGLTDVELWFENSSLPGYLGVATNKAFGGKEFLLWSQDLKQAVLVTRQPSELITKLMSPQAIVSSATTSMFASDEPVVDNVSTNNRSPSPTYVLSTDAPQATAAAAMDVD